MSFFEIIFDLFTAIPFWILIAFLFVMVKFRQKNERRKIYLRWCIVLGIMNLLLIGTHYNAIFNSGPLRGTVIDKTSGKPLAGVEVKAVWLSGGLPPVQFTGLAAVALLVSDALQPKCRASSQIMVTDSNGKFYSNIWYGAKVWHGCGSGFFITSAVGYQNIHRDKFNNQISYRTSSDVYIELSLETIDGKGKGF